MNVESNGRVPSPPDHPEASLELLKALADRSRLRILGALRERPLWVELLAERLSLSASTVSSHLKKLERAGLVRSRREQYYVVYEPVAELLETRLSDLVAPEPSEARAQAGREERYRRRVLQTFLSGGKLLSIPAQRKKRRIVLEHLVEQFDEGRDHPERQVNETLAAFHPDHCMLRRELIVEGLMTRTGGLYRRRSGAADEAGRPPLQDLPVRSERRR